MGVLGGIALAGLRAAAGLGRELVEHSLSGMYHAAQVRANTMTASASLLRTLVLDDDKAQRQAIWHDDPQDASKRSAKRARSTSAGSSPTKIARLFRESTEAREAFSKVRDRSSR